MNFIELVSLVLENLSRRKGRVAMTAIGVVIGSAAVVVLVSLGIGLQRSATERLYGIGDLTEIQVSPNYGEPVMAPAGGVIAAEAMPEITPITDETLEAFRQIPGVKAVIPRDWSAASIILKAGRMESWVNPIGVGADDLSLMGLTAQQGTTVLEKGTMIVGYNVPPNFYDPSARPGQDPPPPPDLMNTQVKMTLVKWTEDGEVHRDVPVRIAGMLTESRGESDWSVYLPLSDLTAYNEWATGIRVNRAKDGYQMVTVRAQDPTVVLDIAEAIKGMGFQAYAPQETVEGINNFFVILQVVFGGVGAIALLVAAIGIANTMAMAILERTREIGLMKAVGATNRDVLSVFLGEAAGIGLIGGLGGVLVGWSVGQFINVYALAYFAGQAAQTGMPPPTQAVVTPIWLPIFALLFAMIIGLLSGLYPALRAATLVPVTALKYE